MGLSEIILGGFLVRKKGEKDQVEGGGRVGYHNHRLKKQTFIVLAAEKNSTFKKMIFGGCTVEIKGCP